jgi:hypothetical protein
MGNSNSSSLSMEDMVPRNNNRSTEGTAVEEWADTNNRLPLSKRPWANMVWAQWADMVPNSLRVRHRLSRNSNSSSSRLSLRSNHMVNLWVSLWVNPWDSRWDSLRLSRHRHNSRSMGSSRSNTSDSLCDSVICNVHRHNLKRRGDSVDGDAAIL